MGTVGNPCEETSSMTLVLQVANNTRTLLIRNKLEKFAIVFWVMFVIFCCFLKIKGKKIIIKKRRKISGRKKERKRKVFSFKNLFVF